MKTLLSEAELFGITIFGDGATIKSVPLMNVMAAGIHNPSALLDIVDCSGHLAKGGKKDARYIAQEVIQPLLARIESKSTTMASHVDLVWFDSASNVQNAGHILQQLHPRITVGHGAEHVVSLLFADCYTKVCQC